MKNNTIHFNEQNHTYIDDYGQESISVSTLLSLLQVPFDEDGSILLKCAQKRGITPEELKAEWEETKNQAGTKGTEFHADVEHFIQTGKIRDGENKDIVKQFKKIKPEGRLQSEVILWDSELKLAGTTDLLAWKGEDLVTIGDYKRTKKLEKYSFWGNKFLHPISHIYDCNFNKFSLQLNLYAWLVERQFNVWVDDLSIYHLKKYKFKEDLLEKHEVPFMPKEVNLILEYLKANRTELLELKKTRKK